MSDATSPSAFGEARMIERLEARRRPEESPGQVVTRDLGRYYELLGMSLRNVAQALTVNEKLALADMSNGAYWDVHRATWIWEQPLEADEADLERWGVDREELMMKLRRLTVIDRVALVDALERFWLLPAEGRGSPEDALSKVGLLEEG